MRQFLFATITLLASAGCQPKNAGTISGGAFGSTFAEVPSAVVGSSLDAQDQKVMEQSSPRTVDRMDRGDPLTIGDIIKLHESGISDETVIRYIRQTKTSYDLNQTQIRRLQNTGVSQRIIDFMLETGR
ncbi:MAG TPA: hypothetical protein VLG44_05680 [Chlamydiales bacterium]|nr:hypothetical protein [Chlamydiales bacterium]